MARRRVALMSGPPAARPGRPRSGRPPKGESAEMAGRIIDAAARLFATQGFAATSMEQVAAACHAGKDTLYRRFPSKTALFNAVLERLRGRILQRLQSEIAPVGDDGCALLRLRQVAQLFLTLNLDAELLAYRRIAFTEGMVFGAARPDAPEAADPILNELVLAVAEAQQAGALRQGPPEPLARHLLHSIVYGPTNEAMLGRAPCASEADQEASFAQAWDFFLHGVAA
ncbi:TetR/AcrR family transcriptional regulator [Pseudoroseomonas cervicalis]|uniref:TetR/AcrR family transcriptional regulator n=1 Tax=Teichococcus cervicalis TaxID=204525 RepID=UPI0022F15F35|nr:TetR/AcrR family transcriptional regulator [Pseudoroseomonas cervicalis]WBV41572.1 helix-turn-helix domain containing protein [Pseudoroseomonas cervicalis]